VLEGVLDCWPWAGLVSGCLSGGDLKSGPRARLATLNGRTVRPTFPEFGRYLLGERVMFLGESNGDHLCSGAANGYWAERQAFLLGAKFDVIHPDERYGGEMNRVLRLALAERERVAWWARRPAYRHTLGLTDVPPDIDGRRVVGAGGATLLAVSRDSPGSETVIRVDGAALTIPAGEIVIVEVQAAGGGGP
jgi:hypothetical protein